MRKLFEEFGDPRGRGLDLNGLKLAVCASKLDQGENKVTPKEVSQFFKRLDIDDTGFISVDQLQFIFDNVLAREHLKEGLQNLGMNNGELLREVFNKFDSSRKGEMNKFDLLAAVHFLGYNITQSNVDTLLAKVDADKNGTIELDEFTAFFEQMKDTEELMEELEKFKRAQGREKYIHSAILLVGTLFLFGGIYVSRYMDVDSDSSELAFAYAAIFGGAVIWSLALLPSSCVVLYRVFVHVCVRTFNPTKAILINVVLTLSLAALFVRQLLSESEEGGEHVNVLIKILSSVLLFVCVAEAIWYYLATSGMLEPVPDVDDKQLQEQRADQNWLAQLVDLERGTSGSKGTSDPEVRLQPSGSEVGLKGSPKAPKPAQVSAPPSPPKRAFVEAATAA